MKITKYPDGTSYVTIPEEWENTYQEITFRVNSYEDVIHLAQLCDVLTHNNVAAHIIIPCLIDAQADKRFGDFNSSGLVVIARLLDTYVGNGTISLGVFHPHNPEVVEAMFTSVEIVDNTEFIGKVLEQINCDNGNQIVQKVSYPNLILMSADAGGFKPLISTANKLDWIGETQSCSKARYASAFGHKMVQQASSNDYEGKDILIIDDISVYGGTFKGLSRILKERNCGKLYLAVSHMTVQNLGEDPVTNYFDKVFTTNSKYDKYYTENEDPWANALGPQPTNLEVIKMF